MNESNVARFGVIGTGRITRRLVADLQSTPNVEVVAIASRTGIAPDGARINMASSRPSKATRRCCSGKTSTPFTFLFHRRCTLSGPSQPLRQASMCSAKSRSPCRRRKRSRSTKRVGSTACAGLDATGWLHHERTDAFVQWIRDGRLGQNRTHQCGGFVLPAVSIRRSPFGSCPGWRLHSRPWLVRLRAGSLRHQRVCLGRSRPMRFGSLGYRNV